MSTAVMNGERLERLATAGGVVTSAADWLGLSPSESALVEMRLQLTYAVREWRAKARLTQTELAARIGTSQSRIAKVEKGDPHVSIDLMIKALLAAGADPLDISAVLAKANSSGAASATK